MPKDVNDKKEKKENKHFFKDFKAELKRVIWPTPKQLVNNTVAVITIVLITAVIVFALDFVFKTVDDYGINKLKEVVGTKNEQSNTTTSNEEANNTTNNITNEAGNPIFLISSSVNGIGSVPEPTNPVTPLVFLTIYHVFSVTIILIKTYPGKTFFKFVFL